MIPVPVEAVGALPEGREDVIDRSGRNALHDLLKNERTHPRDAN
jgi:hypothetical protein